HPYALASCVSGTCRSSFNKSAKTTTCGPNNLTCDALTEICVRRAPVGPAIVYECKPLPVTCNERRNCACVSAGVCTGGYSVCRDEGPNTVGCDCPLCE
ncbi:MAG TPA: hypothetical protein VHM19_21960, partial [Polyangiales bacterium]|nr:hypothetical protein [Polyangiales bacterium]